MVPIVIKEVEIPDGVTVTVQEGVITVEGPKGKLERRLEHPKIVIEKRIAPWSSNPNLPEARNRPLWAPLHPISPI